jgi:hypothetical protein
MNVLAHFGKIPVEEWLPFVVPLLALYVYGRRRERRRRAAVGRLPPAYEQLEQTTIEGVERAWSEGAHRELARRHLPLLFPPGPDGFSVAEIAARIHAEPGEVARLLDELEELDYLAVEHAEDPDERLVSLTFRGYELLDATEVALLGALDARAQT